MAGSSIVGILKVLLTADTAEYKTAMEQASKHASALSKEFTSVGKQMTQVGSALTKTITLPLLALGAGAVKAASDFESSFANVAKTVDGVSDNVGRLTPKGEALAQVFRDMAKEIPATTDELTAIAALGGQMGVPIEQLAHFTKNVAALSVAVDGISAEEAAASLAQIGNATGTGTTKIQEFSSTLVHLGNNSNATEGQILEFTKRLIGAGHSAGMTVPQVMAIGTAMANVGINAEAGGTAMSQVIAKIGTAVSKGGEDLRKFASVANMSAQDFATTWKRSSAEGIDVFVKGLSTMRQRGVDLNLTMGELGTEGIRIASTLKQLAGAGNGVETSLRLANEGFAAGNKHLEEAEKKYGTFQNQLKTLLNNVRDLGIELGTALLPALKSMVALAQSLVPVIEMLVKAFTAMPSWVQMSALAFGAVVAAAGPLLWITGQLITAIGTVIGAFKAKGIAMTAINAIMGTSVVTSGALRVALMGVGSAAAVVATAFASWNIGKWIGEWSGLTNVVGYFSAKLGELTGLLPKGAAAQYTATVRAQQAAEASKKQAKATAEVATEVAALAELNKVVIPQLNAQASAQENLGRALRPVVTTQEHFVGVLGEYVITAGDAAAATEAMWEEFYRLTGQVQTIAPILQNAMNQVGLIQNAMFAGFKESVQQMGPALKKSFDSIADAFKNLGNTILAAITGGGNILSAIGSSLGKALGEDLAANLGGFLTKHLGNTLGGALSAVLPGIGALLGPALSAIGGGLKKLFGIGVNEEVKKANREIQAVRDSLLQTHGSLEALEQKARAVGLSFEENWGHQGQAGLAAFNELVEEFNRRWEALQADLASTRDEFSSLIDKAREFGYEFNEQGQFVSVNFERMRDVAEQFGINLSSLGPAFNAHQIQSDAMSVINAFELMSKGGADAGTILFGLKDEIGKIVGDSIKFGTTIPANMKPWIEELIRTNQLVDDNGVAITDLSQIKFSDPVETQFESIAKSLQDVVQKLDDLISRITSIPTEATFTVRKEYIDPGPPQGFYDGVEGGYQADPGHAVGTLGRWGSWFKDFGAGFNTALHGMEAVVTPQQAPAFAMDVLGAMGGGGSAMSVDFSGLEARLMSVERLLENQPRHMAYAVQEAMSGRGTSRR